MSGKSFNSVTSWNNYPVSVDVYETEATCSDSGYVPHVLLGDGVQSYTSGPVNTTSYGEYVGHCTTDTANIVQLSYGRFRYFGGHYESADVALIVPFYDSEAAYIWGVKTTTEELEGYGGDCTNVPTSAGAFYRPVQHYIYSGGSWQLAYSFVEFNGASGGYLAATPTDGLPTETSTSHAVIANSLVTSTGTLEFTPPDSMTPFFTGGNYYVSRTFNTNTSTLGSCYGYGAEKLDGFPSTFVSTENPPFIGWA
jgi:hypothetical protein